MAAFLPVTAQWKCERCQSRAGSRGSLVASQGLNHLRLRYPLHLPRASWQRAGRISGSDRRSRTVRPNRRDWARLPQVQGRRSRDRLSHLRMRRVQRLPPRLHDLLHQRQVSPRLRLAARRRHGRIHARRRKGSDRFCPTSFPMPMARRWPAGSAPCTKGSRRSASAAIMQYSSPALVPWAWPAGALCRKLGAEKIIGIDMSCRAHEDCDAISACAMRCLRAGPDNVAEVRELTGGHGRRARSRLLRQTPSARHGNSRYPQMGKDRLARRRGPVEFNPSPDMIHDQKTIYGSWVTSTWLMEELVERLVRWNLHPAEHHHAQVSSRASRRSLQLNGFWTMRQSRGLPGWGIAHVHIASSGLSRAASS